jgi:hypothetical protein
VDEPSIVGNTIDLGHGRGAHDEQAWGYLAVRHFGESNGDVLPVI